MKTLAAFFLSSILTLTTAFSATTLQQTDIDVERGPTVKQLKVAKKILGQAIKAIKKNDQAKYLKKLKKAQSFQSFRTVKKTYNAAIVARYKGKNYNYLAGESFTGFEIRYNSSFADTCFNGNSSEVVRMLQAAVDRDYLNFDEEWYEKPRVEGDKVVVDDVDGPGECTVQISISACQAK